MENVTAQNAQVRENPSAIYSDAIFFDFCYDNFSIHICEKTPDGVDIHGRIKVSPQTMKSLMRATKDSVKRYESIYGTIKEFDEKAQAREKEAIAANTQKKIDKAEEELQELINKAANKQELLRRIQEEAEKLNLQDVADAAYEESTEIN